MATTRPTPTIDPALLARIRAAQAAAAADPPLTSDQSDRLRLLLARPRPDRRAP